MSWEKVARCDKCGKFKGEANKWLVVGGSVNAFMVRHWPIDNVVYDEELMICSETCLQKKLGEFLRYKVIECLPEKS